MNDAYALLATLRKDKVQLWVQDGQLRYRLPSGTLDPERLLALRAQKQAIIALLEHPSSLTSPLAGSPRPPTLPLSFTQEGQWFLDQLGLLGSAYNLSVVWRVQGLLNLGWLGRAVDELVRRHEDLRTRFLSIDGVSRQIIDAPSAGLLDLIDLSSSEPATRHEEALKLISLHDQHQFDLSSDRLFRVYALRLGATEHLLHFSMHHIVVDASSMDIIFRELAALYAAYGRGQASPLPPLRAQYADFALWQRRWLQGDVLDGQLAYWKRHLAGAPKSLDLPTDRPRPATPTFRGGFVPFTLDAPLCAGLRALALEQRVTLFILMLAAIQTLLSRLSGQTDVVVGSPIEGRNHPETEALIGYFANALAFRADLSMNPSFTALLTQVKASVLGAYENRDLPFGRLVAEISPERDLSRHPLFQVDFVYQSEATISDGLSLPGLAISQVTTDQQTAKFDLEFSLSEIKGSLEGGVEYTTDLFDRAAIERLIGYFKVLLAAIVADPSARIGDLALLEASERRQLLVDLNATAAPTETCCIHELFERQVVRTPAAVAVECDGVRLSYGELNSRANRLAHHLRSLGAAPEVLVGICLERSADMVVGLLGILKAGAAYLPLDPAYPLERLSFMLEDSGAAILVTESALADRLEGSHARVVCIDADWPHVAAEPDSNPPLTARPANLAYCIYTSGSTGRPKGVATPHQGLTNLVRWHQDRYRPKPDDRVTQLASVSFDACGWEIWPYLTAGACLVVLDDETRRSPDAIVEALAERSITLSFLPTPLAEPVLALNASRKPKLKALLTGGDVLHSRPRDDCGFSVINHYGVTECSVVSTSGQIETGTDFAALPTIGRPITNTQVYILDPAEQPVPIGIPGQLYISGAGLARGYHNRPALTADRFVPNPFGEPGSRMYRTGDLGRYLVNGDIDIQGRIDNQISIRGFRIEPGEIEAALAAHPAVRESVVVATENAEHEKRLLAYIVLNGKADGANVDWRHHLRSRVPDYLIPSAFVTIDDLPRLPSGKIDRPALLQLQYRAEGRAAKAPRNAIEATIAKVWCELLGLSQVDIDDDFFALGGQSLLVMQVVSRIRSELRIALPLRLFFENRTVADLGRAIETLKGMGHEPLRPPHEARVGEL